MSSVQCEECGAEYSIVIDSRNGDEICTECGTVQQAQHLWTDLQSTSRDQQVLPYLSHISFAPLGSAVVCDAPHDTFGGTTPAAIKNDFEKQRQRMVGSAVNGVNAFESIAYRELDLFLNRLFEGDVPKQWSDLAIYWLRVGLQCQDAEKVGRLKIASAKKSPKRLKYSRRRTMVASAVIMSYYCMRIEGLDFDSLLQWVPNEGIHPAQKSKNIKYDLPITRQGCFEMIRRWTEFLKSCKSVR